MSFKSYAVHSTANGLLELSDPCPLVFSGRNGIIARFVAVESTRAEKPWKLCVGEIHSIAFPSRLLHDRAVVFEEAEDSERALLWLHSVSGVSGTTTEMLFSFEPLTVVKTYPLLVSRPKGARVYGEDLCLDGGVAAPGGSWRWKKPHLALGGVVVGGNRAAAV